MENYIETLEQVIILLEDNRKITCHGDNIECNQILIDNLHDVYKFIKNNENRGKNMYVIMFKDSSKYNLIEAITNDYHKWIEEHNQDKALDEDEKCTLDDFIIIDIKPTIF